MSRTCMILFAAASTLAFVPSCAQQTAPAPMERKTEVKVDIEDDGTKRVTKEKEVHLNPDGTKTETTRKTEVKTEVHDGKIIDLPGVEIRKKD